jgi:uncharacterized protein (TIGR00661 family)
MKFLFVVQGEGRGHLTQSIALKNMLIQNGHEVVAVLVGKSKRRELPAFFAENMNLPVYRFDSPNFLPASRNKKTNMWSTIIYNLLKSPSYFRSLYFIKRQIRESNVDVVVNFYEMMMGLTYAVFPPKTPYVSVAHQYLFLHPEYKFPSANRVELILLKFFTRITCLRSTKIFALSIEQKKNVPRRRMVVVPPLLRSEIFDLTPREGDYLHGYILNSNYADEIIEYQKRTPSMPLHFFWDRKNVEEKTVVNDYLTFHNLNDKLFVEYMAGCKGYVTTAGFESVCEAMYFGKPVLMIPTHIEQSCNAYEASRAGAGIVSNNFDLNALISYLPAHKQIPGFRLWAQQSEACWMKEFDLSGTGN